MKIVIDIPEKVITAIQNGEDYRYDIHTAIAQGTPLPKKYGRLIDADETLKAMDTWDKFGYTITGILVRNPSHDYVLYVHYEDMIKAVKGMPTIVEADK